MTLLTVLLGVLCLTGVLHAAPLVLDRSTITEVVNQVDLIAVSTQVEIPATVRAELRAPDRLRTGRNSRAELQASDGTITRIGAGTLFAFDPKGRELRLDRGSLLFHSPTGRGGGKIRTESASATVLGTTLIAATTPDGGYKLLVLEGNARVDFNSGARLDLSAGQMTFVRPAGNGVGAPGPVLQFDLSRQIRSSKLVNGFTRALPSLPRIEREIQTQTRGVSQGRYMSTGFLVFAATSDTQVSGIETAGPDSDDKLKGEFTAPQRLALSLPVTLSGPALPQAHLFRTHFLVPARESVFLNKESDVLMTGLLSDTLVITSPTIDLSTWNEPGDFHLVAKTSILLPSSLEFTALGKVNYIRLFSPVVQLPAKGAISMNFGNGGVGTFYIDSDKSLTLASPSLTVLGGGMILQPHSGDLNISGGTLRAMGLLDASVVVPTAINLHAPLGAVDVSGASLVAPAGSIAAQGHSLSLRQSSLSLGGNLWLDSATSLTIDTLQITAPVGAIFQATGNDVLTARSLNFGSFTEINMGARTIVLESVHFAAGSTVRLVSETGQLAPQPNTGQNALPGFVNFVRDVSYGGHPAQDHVPKLVGGTGLDTPAIQISTPN